MHSIKIQDYDNLMDLMMKEIHTFDTQEEFLHNLGYKSATWIEGTFNFAFNSYDYTMFLLRWAHNNR